MLETITVAIEPTFAPSEPKREVANKRTEFTEIRDVMLFNLVIKQNKPTFMTEQFTAVELS